MGLDYVRYGKIPMYFRWSKWTTVRMKTNTVAPPTSDAALKKFRVAPSNTTLRRRNKSVAADSKNAWVGCGSEDDEPLTPLNDEKFQRIAENAGYSALKCPAPKFALPETCSIPRTKFLLNQKAHAKAILSKNMSFKNSGGEYAHIKQASFVAPLVPFSSRGFNIAQTGRSKQDTISRGNVATRTRLLLAHKMNGVEFETTVPRSGFDFSRVLLGHNRVNAQAVTLSNHSDFMASLNRVEQDITKRSAHFHNDFGFGVDYNVDPTQYDTADVRGLDTVCNTSYSAHKPTNESRRGPGRPRMNQAASSRRSRASIDEYFVGDDSDTQSEIEQLEQQALTARFCPIIEDPQITILKEHELSQISADTFDIENIPADTNVAALDQLRHLRPVLESQIQLMRILQSRYQELSLNLKSSCHMTSTLKKRKAKAVNTFISKVARVSHATQKVNEDSVFMSTRPSNDSEEALHAQINSHQVKA